MELGKTTFFNCLNEDMEIDEGEFYLEESDKTRKLEADDVGYVLSTPNVITFHHAYIPSSFISAGA